MKAIFFDTETTGTPINYKGKMTDLGNWPRVIQLGWEVADLATGEMEHGTTVLIKPEGWTIPKEKFWIDNGFNTEKNHAEGIPMAQALDLFLVDYNASEIMVAHNMAFDYPILGAEMIRYKKKASRPLDKFCTMATTVDLCKIPFGGDRRPWKNRGGYKWPKLEELYKFLFKEKLEGAHDAGNDVAACRRCFFELVRLGVIEVKPVNV